MDKHWLGYFSSGLHIQLSALALALSSRCSAPCPHHVRPTVVVGLLTCFSVPSLKTRSASLSPTHSLLFSAAFFSLPPSLPSTYMLLTRSASLLIFPSLPFFSLIQSGSPTTFHRSPAIPSPPASSSLFHSLVFHFNKV